MKLEKTSEMIALENRLIELAEERDRLSDLLHTEIIEQMKPHLDSMEGVTKCLYYISDFSEFIGMAKFDVLSLLCIKRREFEKEKS